jgi:hypothetical protein
MRANFIILAFADVALLILAASMGLAVIGSEGFVRHFLLGMLAAVFACFVHMVVFVYVVVQDKIAKEAFSRRELAGQSVARISQAKRLAVRASLLGICCVVVTSGLGAAIAVGLEKTAHLLSAAITLAATACVHLYQGSLIAECESVWDSSGSEGAGVDPSPPETSEV